MTARARHVGTAMRRLAAIGALASAVAVVAVILLGGGDAGHRVSVTVPSATNIAPGQDVRLAGRPVGEVTSVDPVRGGRGARVGLRIDERAWPLRKGSELALRWGGSISFSNRYLELKPGPSSGPALPEGAQLPSSALAIPVELDQLLATFDASTRRKLKGMLDRGGPALRRAKGPLRDALRTAPSAVGEVHAVLRDLEAEQRRLDVLVRSADRAVAAVNASSPGVGDLASGAAATFDAIASEASGLEGTLRAAPSTLARARGTLGRADTTLRAAGSLLDDLRPGVAEVRRLAAPLARVLRTVVQVGPDVRTTLASARRAAPDLNPLLARGARLMPQLGSIGRQATKELNCIRPYTPEIVAFFSNWADFLNSTDGKDLLHRGAVDFIAPIPHNAQVINSGQAARNAPGLRYAFPMPPGYLAGQPWFLPECGVGPESLDPTKDPEARPFDPLKLKSPPRGAARREGRR